MWKYIEDTGDVDRFDMFAFEAMKILLAERENPDSPHENFKMSDISSMSYNLASEMVKERKRYIDPDAS